MNYKTAFRLLGIGTAVSHVFLIGVALDRAVSADYAQQSIRHLHGTAALLQRLLVDVAGETDRRTVEAIAKQRYADRVVKEEDGVLYIDDIGFEFDNDKLVRVRLLNDPPVEK